VTPAGAPHPDHAVDPDAVLGVLLGTLRVGAGLTLEAAAAASGLPATRLRGVEDGDGRLPLADGRALARAYGLPFVAFAARFERALAAAERRARRDGDPGAAVPVGPLGAALVDPLPILPRTPPEASR
jgi:transcriptional regulator with XRE-family HTH domain